MRTPIHVLPGLALWLSFAPVLARPAEQEVKLGYVELQRAMTEVEEGKAAKALLKKEFDEKQKLLAEKEQEVMRMKANFDKQSATMTKEAKQSKQKELDDKVVEFRRLHAQFEEEMAKREGDLTEGIFNKMQAIVNEIAKAGSFTMVFEKQGTGVLFAPASTDLTSELIKRYNAKHKGGSTP